MSEMIPKNEGEQKSTLLKEEATKKSTLFKSEASGVDTVSVKKPNGSKNAIIFSLLGALLGLLIVALSLLLIFKPDLGEDDPPFEVLDGEDAFGTTHLMYPLVDDEAVTQLDLYNDGEKYSFVRYWNEETGKYAWRVEGVEEIALNLTSFEMLRMWLCTVTTKTPIRNATDEQLVTYGVDKPNQDSFTIYYEENGENKSHTVRIGKKTDLSTNEYYAYYEGRNHIYKISPDIINYTDKDSVYYLSPVINTFFGNETTVLYGIDHFKIYLTDGANTKLNHLLSVEVSERGDLSAGETSIEFNTVYSALALGVDRTIVSSTIHLNTVFATLYTSFSGSEVVLINPSDDELSEFGLASNQEKYFLEVEFASDAQFANAKYREKDPDLFISRKIDNYYYVMSEYYGVKTVVRVDAEKLSFLGEEPHLLLKWADTNSVKTGFFETLTKTDTAPGLDQLIVKTLKNDETFLLSYDEAIDELTVYAQNTGLVFKDDNSEGNSFGRNKFRNLYIYMLYFPFIYSFNEMTEAETLEYIKEENLVYSIMAQRNDETVVRYSYYSISGSLAVERVETGKVKNGEIVFDAPTYGNICEKEQIRRVTNAIDKLLAGEELLPDEDILK